MTPMTHEGGPDLRDYLAVIRRRKWLIAFTTAAVVCVAVALAVLQTPVYRASADVLLQPRASEEIFNPNPQAQSASNQPAAVRTEIELIKSRSVRDAVTEALGRTPQVSISAKGDTSVVTISASSTDPKLAAEEANTYAETYVAVRRQALIDDLLAAADQVQSQLQKIDEQIAALQVPIDDLERQIANTDDADARLRLQGQHDQLESDTQPQVQSLQSRRGIYADQLDRLNLATNLTQTGGAQIVSKAGVPASPYAPTPRRNAILALVVGMMLGVGLAFAREYLDDTIKSKDDLEEATPGLSALTLVPLVTTWKDRENPTLITLASPHAPASEAYRTLRTSLQFIGLDEPLGIIQLTSPSAAEGKTTTVANLGVAFARAGMRTVLVDCDLRRPRVHKFFGLTNDVGITNVLLGECSLGDAIRPLPDERLLAVLPSGPVPANPAELLSSRRTGDVLRLIKDECDVVLVDGPPVLPVTDALILAGVVDGTLVVATASVTTKRDTHRSVEQLSQVGAPLIGTVLNGVDLEGGYGYGYRRYGYRYAYSHSTPRRRRDGWFRRSSREPKLEDSQAG